jgi:hypothetical protein
MRASLRGGHMISGERTSLSLLPSTPHLPSTMASILSSKLLPLVLNPDRFAPIASIHSHLVGLHTYSTGPSLPGPFSLVITNDPVRSNQGCPLTPLLRLFSYDRCPTMRDLRLGRSGCSSHRYRVRHHSKTLRRTRRRGEEVLALS